MAKVLGVLVAALVAWGSAAQADEQGRWQQLENNPSCSVWNAHPNPIETMTGSGACANGKANGSSTLRKRGGQYFSGYWTNGCFKQGEREAWIATSREACGFD